MNKILTGNTTGTLLKIVLVLVGAYIAIELIEGLVGYAGIAAIQATVVESLLAGTVPGFLLVGGVGVLVGGLGVLAVLWVLDRI